MLRLARIPERKEFRFSFTPRVARGSPKLHFPCPSPLLDEARDGRRNGTQSETHPETRIRPVMSVVRGNSIQTRVRRVQIDLTKVSWIYLMTSSVLGHSSPLELKK